LRAFAGVTGNLTCLKPSTSRLKSSAFAVSSTLNAVCASPRSVLPSRSRATVAMALILPYSHDILERVAVGDRAFDGERGNRHQALAAPRSSHLT
jgi:hypothetical protein